MTENDRIDLSVFLPDYLSDCEEGFRRINDALLALEKDYSQTGRLDEVFRAVHTLKSSSAMLEFSSIAELAHTCEDLLDRLRRHQAPLTQQTIDLLFEVVDQLEVMVEQQAKGRGDKAEFQALAAKVKRLASGETHSGLDQVARLTAIPSVEKLQSVKVNIDVLDSLFNLVGELIITRNRIDNIVSDSVGKELKAALATMDQLINELQEQVSTARLVPVGEIFQRFPKMVRDLSRDAKKEVELVVEGGEIELDKAMLDAISEPLVHLLKNAVDHGIEPAEARRQLGKKQSGSLRLAARRTENHILIDVEDDGCGIDVARLKRVFVRQGLISSEESASVTDADVLELLFEPGTSTAEKVTSISGRGVGLDVVKTSAKRLGGTVEVATEKGGGSRFRLQLPLSTAVMQTLMVGVGNHVFAIPTDVVQETLEIRPQDLRKVRDNEFLVLRQEAIPFIRLDQVLDIHGQQDPGALNAVIIRTGGRSFGLGVDTVLNQVENIVKPFDPIARRFKGFSGGTILGDGSVALLLDIANLSGFETLKKERYAA